MRKHFGMRLDKTLWLIGVLLLAAALRAPAQDTVTIPKSRLEELQRAEEELKKLKGEEAKSRKPAEPETQKEQKERPAPVTRRAPEPKVTRVSPQMATLPALKTEETVDAIDLVNHYRADAGAADRRYLKKKFLVRGQIAGFEKRLFVREYRIIFRTEDPDVRLMCTVFPPEEYKAVFKTHNGSELTGVMLDESRVPLAKIGDTVVVAGDCRGLRDNIVVMTGCGLRSVQPHVAKQ